jgi:hypothetical protein
MWRQEIALLERADPMPINRELRTADELLAHDRQERIKNGLKGRMLAVVPRGDTTSLDADVIDCYRRLFQKQRLAVHGSTIQSKIDAFTAVQRRYSPSSFSFDRFYENEAVIDDAELEMDRNLEAVWPWILLRLHVPLPNPLLTASEIKAWVEHPDNQEVWNQAEDWLDIRLALTSLPSQVCHLTNLTGVNLSFNCLTNLPTEFNALNHIEHLDLSSNLFKHVPPVVCQLAQLRSLNLSSNQLSDLPQELEGNNQLQTLNISNNQFTQISSVVCRLEQLTFLNVSSNQLSDLPQELEGNNQLQTLNISNNQFTQVPSVIARLTNLRNLNMSDNQIQALPAFLTNPHRVSFSFALGISASRNFNVSNNPIRSIHCLLDDCEGVDMTGVEEISISLQDWIILHFNIPFLEVNLALIVLFGIPIQLVMLRFGNFFSAHPILSMILQIPVILLMIPIFGLFSLVGGAINVVIWSINTFITNVIGPIIGFARELLGYPPTIRLRNALYRDAQHP